MPVVKKLIFTFITVVVVPLLFFVVLEFGLKLAGIGTSYDYFFELNIDGVAHYQENPDFADQFYPSSLNIGPLENTFAKDRDDDVVRVYILGGSAAQGFPHKNHGFDRLLSAQLRAALPGKSIEVINTAMTSVNSHVVYAVANSLPDESADFAVILMGNNEVVGPYGPGTFNQNFLSSLGLIRTVQALKRTRTWQALGGLIAGFQSDNAMQDLEWEGMQMFANHGVPADDARMASVYSHYRENLKGIVDRLQDKGMNVVLSSVPVNLRHSAPFLSVHGEDLSDDESATWRNATERGESASAAGDWDSAVSAFQAAVATDPGHADSHFRLATALENTQQYEEAKQHYRLALDLDALRFRTDSQLDRIVRDVADDHAFEQDFLFVDNAEAFEDASQPYQPGWNLFLEHVHFDFAGNHILAAEISQAIAAKVQPSANRKALADAEVARRVGFPNYDTAEEIRNLQGMIEQPPFPGQSNYPQLQDFLDAKLTAFSNATGSQEAIVARRQAVADAGLADWKIHFELAVLQQRLRNPPAMYHHLDRIVELYPHNRETYMKLAQELSRDGRWREVIPHLERSLYYTRGDTSKIAEAINWLGTAFLRIGDYDSARQHLLQVAKDYPDEIDLSLKAYANLIRHARQNGLTDDLDEYRRGVQRYAERLLRQQRAEEYPLIYERMAQIMRMGGFTAEAEEWAAAKPQ